MLATGTAFAGGSFLSAGKAFDGGSIGIGGAGPSGSGSSGSSSGSSSSSSSSSKSKSSSSSSSSSANKEADEFLEKMDWIEVAIDRIERAISKLDLKASSVFKKWSTRNSALTQQIAKVREEIDLQERGAQRYLQEANSVGLSSAYAAKVRNGEINIEDITDEDLKEKIDEYQEWYEKYLDCIDAAEELRETENELYAQKFDNVVTQYDGILSLMEHEKNMLEEFVNQSEANAWLVSENYYKALEKSELERLAELKEEEAMLLATFNEIMKDSSIDETSEQWVEMCKSINDVTIAIEESETALLEYRQTLQQLNWEVFDILQDRISKITEESEFLIDLMSSDKLYNDKGQFTNQGTATAGLYGVNFNVAMAQADQYAEEIKKIENELAKDPFDTDLKDRYYELVEAQQDAILSAQDYKENIRNLVEEGIQLELEALEELIDKRNEALDSQKDAYEYQKKVKEQIEEISALEKQMAAYRGDDSEETRAKIQELKISLEEAEQELEETEYDKYISDQEKLMDDLYLEYETILNERLDNLDLLISEMIAYINENAVSISDTISTEADAVGYELSESMKTIWNNQSFVDTSNSINNVITTYGDKFLSSLTTTNAALGNISTDIETMIGQLNKIAKTNVKSAKQTAAAKAAEAAKKAAAEEAAKKKAATKTTTTSSGDGKPKVGDKVKFVSGNYYYDSTGRSPLGSMYQGKEVYITSINNASWATHPYHISTGNRLGKGDLGWLKLNQISGYATGKKNFLSDEIAWTQENGREFIIRPSDGAVLTPLAKNDSVLNAAASNNLWNMANSPAEFIKDSLGIGGIDAPVGTGGQTNVEQNFEQIVFSMPNVKNYDEMLAQMKSDKNFQRLVDAMGIGQLAGKSSLRKGKSIR